MSFDGSVSWLAVMREARLRFGIKAFRSAPRDVLESVFAGQDTLAIMPTGAGKSLTYQLPAAFFPRPVVVVSPLIALMQDQQEKAAEADLVVDRMDFDLDQCGGGGGGGASGAWRGAADLLHAGAVAE